MVKKVAYDTKKIGYELLDSFHELNYAILSTIYTLLHVTACSSCSPPDLNLLDPYFIYMYMRNNHCHRATAHLQVKIIIIIIICILKKKKNLRMKQRAK